MEPPIRRHPDAIGWTEGRRSDLRGRFHAARSCGAGGGSLGEDLFVRDRGQHLAGAVAPAVVVGVYEPGDLAAGLVLGVEVSARQELPLEGRVEALRGGVVQRRADPSHRLGHPERLAGLGEHVTDVLAALVGVEHDTVDVATAGRGGHAQGGPGQRRVVVFPQREPGQSPRRQVKHGRQVQLALLGGDLGQVPAPALVDRLALKFRLSRSGIGAAALSGRVRLRRFRFGQRPRRPWRAIEAATVFFDTRQPASTRSSNTLGDP